MTATKSSHIFQGMVLGALVALSISTFGLGGELDKDARVFPYSGTLEYNGSGYTGTVDFKFTVTGTATNTDGGTTTTTFSEQHENVSVYAGKFQVSIGSKTSSGVPTWVFDQERVYISMDVRDGAGSGTSGFSALTGKQRIYPAPFAYWAAEGNKLTSDGYTYLKAGVTIGGSDLALGTDDGRSQYKSGNTPDAGARLQQRALVHTGDDQLFLNYSGDFEGGLVLTGPTTHTGTFSQTGATTLTGTTTQAGALTVSSGSLTVSSGDVTLSNGALNLNRAGTTMMNLIGSTGSDVTTYWQNSGGGKWNVGAGGTAGTNDFYFYNHNNSKIALEITAEGDALPAREVYAPNNKWGNGGISGGSNGCRWEAESTGTTANGETIEKFCTDGYYAAGYSRYHGNFDYGIETLKLYCCPL